MKPILFATNYTPASINAGDYAAQLAKICNAPLIVLHTWTMPVLTPEDAVAVPPPEEFHARERKEIESEVNRLRTRWGVDVTGIEVNGYAPDEIETTGKEHDVCLVVMGLHHQNFFGRLIGSVATTALHHAAYPILLVPEKVPFEKPEKVLFAADASHEVDDRALDALKLLVRTMGSSLDIVNVETPEELWNVHETPGSVHLEQSLQYLQHKTTVEVSENITEGIKHAAEISIADWIAVAPRHFKWFEDIINRGVTRELAYSTDRPLLVLPSIHK